MTRRRSGSPCHREGGFALIEVIVSALIVVLTTAAVVRTLTATGHAGVELRHRSQAYAIAQEDQARMRSMRIADLQQGPTSRTVTLNNVAFTVTSNATFVNNKTGTTNCGTEGSADYVRIGSKVSWPSQRENVQPVLVESIDTPVSGSVDPTSGGFAISIHGANPESKWSGFGIKGSGPASFSGATNSEGCALFGGLPAGTYSIALSPGSSGWVDPNGKAPETLYRSIVGGTTVPVELEYDLAGQMSPIKFEARNANGSYYAAKADSASISQTGMQAVRVLGTPGGSLASQLPTTKTYFPFTTPYNVTAGTCTTTTPESGASSPIVPRGGEVATTAIKLPVLYITVLNSEGTTSAEKEGIGGARVTLTTLTEGANKCTNEGTAIKRVFTTTTAKGTQAARVGALAEPGVTTIEAPGVPAGEYELCVSKEISKEQRKLVKKRVLIASPTGALTVEGVAQSSLPLVLDMKSATKGSACP